MFKSAVVKLTAWYVAVLVLVCFVFSIPLYNVASARLRRGAELQTDIVRRLPDPFQSGQFIPQIEQQREKQLAEDRRELFISFVIIDSTITLIGGFAGYYEIPGDSPDAKRGGGKLALADNTAGLIRLAGREARMTPLYAHLIRTSAARAIGAPP